MRYRIYFLFIFLALFSCKKEKETIYNPVIDNYVYEINGEEVYSSNIEKDKQKTPEQYLSILYTNLFQTAIPQNDLNELAQVRQAIGDKQLVDELFLNSFSNRPSVNIPTDQEMRADLDAFIENTYLRFYLRKPTPYEVYELKLTIEADEAMTASMIYQAFALSNEYKFY